MEQFFPHTFLYGGDYNPEQWPEEIWREDMRLMKLAHVTMVSINIFSWAALEPQPDHYHFDQLDRIMDMLAQNNILADLATGTASPPTWMTRHYPSMLPVTRRGVRLTHGSRQHYCPNSPDYRRKSGALVQRLAERYAQHPALAMWHLNNEYGCHVPVCYCDNCAAAFRLWLQEKYQSLENFNFAWGTSFWSQRYFDWEDVLPPRATPAQNNPTHSLDYWRFMSDSILGCYRVEEDVLRSITPNVPLTTNFMVAFKPVDGFAWAKHMDIISFDMYPHPLATPPWEVALPHDLMRSLKGGQPHFVMEQTPGQTNWMPQNPQKRPGQMRLQSLQALAHGANGVMFFQWRQSQAGAEQFHSAVVSHDGTEQARIFKQASQVGTELQHLAPEITGSRVQAEVAIVMDWDNWWALEYGPGPSNLLKYWEQLKRYYHPLYELNIMVDVVQPASDLSKYKLVIAPTLYMLRPGEAKNLEQFVERGGTLLTTYFSGIVDQNNHVMLGGYPAELRKVLGLHVEEFDPWTPEMSNKVLVHEGELRGAYTCTTWGDAVRLEGAQAIGVFASDYHANNPALTVNTFGQGHAYYIATQGSDELLAALTRFLCEQAQVATVLKAPKGVEVTKRILPDGKVIYFLLNYNSQKHLVKLPDGNFTSLLDDQSVKDTIEIAGMDAAILREV